MASVALKDASCARGNPDFTSGSNWAPGRTVAVYVNGKFAGVQATGPYGNVGYGQISGQTFMPGSADVPAGAGKAVSAKDNTDITTTATTTVTLT